MCFLRIEETRQKKTLLILAKDKEISGQIKNGVAVGWVLKCQFYQSTIATKMLHDIPL